MNRLTRHKKILQDVISKQGFIPYLDLADLPSARISSAHYREYSWLGSLYDNFRKNVEE